MFIGWTWGAAEADPETPAPWSFWTFKESLTDAPDTGDWGQLALGCGHSLVSNVIDTGNTDNKDLTISFDDYASGSGAGDIYWRGDSTSFNQDDDELDGPAWEEYTGPATKNWRYIQIMVT